MMGFFYHVGFISKYLYNYPKKAWDNFLVTWDEFPL